MKLNKTKILIIVIVSAIIGALVGVFTINHTENNKTYNGKPLYTSSAMQMYDTSTPEQAIGISDYVFVAKINKILRTEYTNRMKIEVGFAKTKTVSNPYTIYEINVIENIKGSLRTDIPIEYMQYGGINEDGESYTFMNGGKLLNEGGYYILMVGTWGDKYGETIEVADPNRIVYLGDTYTPNEKSSLVSEYKSAYQNQIVPPDFGENVMSKFDINYKEE